MTERIMRGLSQTPAREGGHDSWRASIAARMNGPLAWIVVSATCATKA